MGSDGHQSHELEICSPVDSCQDSPGGVLLPIHDPRDSNSVYLAHTIGSHESNVHTDIHESMTPDPVECRADTPTDALLAKKSPLQRATIPANVLSIHGVASKTVTDGRAILTATHTGLDPFDHIAISAVDAVARQMIANGSHVLNTMHARLTLCDSATMAAIDPLARKSIANGNAILNAVYTQHLRSDSFTFTIIDTIARNMIAEKTTSPVRTFADRMTATMSSRQCLCALHIANVVGTTPGPAE
ncbi:hypothetical protein B0A48_06641 [Cryoendolithus antarcticus]|uniref:Uncharacterized protein n=1 Tax=Cryoendolithus antarcticus TaxID=1507870 RepID=A0A1V8T920_9PEZI|nr:hypothetical protein B0A48_06641 [Cryoendolithus antarcticus]